MPDVVMFWFCGAISGRVNNQINPIWCPGTDQEQEKHEGLQILRKNFDTLSEDMQKVLSTVFFHCSTVFGQNKCFQWTSKF